MESKKMINHLPPLKKLELDGESSTVVGLKWERWKRSLSIYLEALEIDCPKRKRATMLHLGGTKLQEIFYSLPGANVETVEGSDVYKLAIELLDDYLLPKHSLIYERQVFRSIKQKEGEKFVSFLSRLRNQAHKCKFSNSKEQLIDQIVEKCTSNELREKNLTIGDDITVDRIITEANTVEAVNVINSKENNLYETQTSSKYCDLNDYCKTFPKKRKGPE